MMKKQCFRALLFLLCSLFLSAAAQAEAPSFLENTAFQKAWATLNYYKKTSRGITSEITNSDFFLASDGVVNPISEAKAFLEIVEKFQIHPTKENTGILCKFPARLTLFSRYMDGLAESRPACSEFEEVNQLNDIKSLSLLFASGYFGSPSSYFGHNLIKVNYNDDVLNQTTLDASLNYGAQVRDATSSPLYFIRGLSGGYEASYQRNNNFLHSHNYTHAQLRDIWDYELNLTQSQVRFIIEHSWEMQRARFPYYFISNNCAHRIMRLLELATNQDLTKTHGPWLLPFQSVQKAHAAGLIQKETYHQSLKSQYFERLYRLPMKKRQALKTYLALPLDEQREIVADMDSDMLLMALMRLDLHVAQRTLKKPQESALTSLQERRGLILHALLRRPKEQVTAEANTQQDETLLTQNAISNAWVGASVRDGEAAITFRYQVAHNDLLSDRQPNQEASRFIMGAVEGGLTDKRMEIREATAIDIVHLNTQPISDHFKERLSWQLGVDYKSQSQLCTDCATFGLQSMMGKAARLSEKTLVYGLIGGRLNHRQREDEGMVTALTEGGLLHDLTPQTRATAKVLGRLNPRDGMGTVIYDLEGAHHYKRNRNIRARIQTDGYDTVVALHLGVQWN